MENIYFLGVIIDLKLTWSTLISSIKRKVSKGIAILCKARRPLKASTSITFYIGIAILCKARRLLKASTSITLYYSFIYPYFTYCIEVWGHTCDKYMSSLFKVQKRAVRILTSLSYLGHTLPIFSNPKILNIYNIYNYQILIFMLKHKKGLLPSI